MKTVVSISIALLVSIWVGCGWAAEPPPPPAQEEPEVLASGPVNESFAEPVNLENQAGIVVPTQPPPNIEEVPPADRPVGDEYVWVPGYWGWDPSRNGYIWVSGCWRAAPPGMYWVPGYWMAVAGGWQWVAGFWSPEANSQIEYLPEPPALTDVEPPGPAPGADKIWVPPCWYWDHGGYILRAGYWAPAYADWVWVPSHYVWTPRGYVFVTGYWDYPLSRRGLLFAPVYFSRRFYERPGAFYSPSIVVDIANLAFGLFTYPRYSHYYFGDYYGNAFIRIGLYPWFQCVSRHTWYDPIYFHDRWRHFRTEPRWEERQRHEYERRLADRRLRPVRTYREMERRISRLPESQRRAFRFAEPMNAVVARKSTRMKFERIEGPVREQLRRNSTEVRTFRERRSKWESQGTSAREGRPSVERIPSAERRRTTAPRVERKGQEMKPSMRREMAPGPTERRGPEMQRPERREPQMQRPGQREPQMQRPGQREPQMQRPGQREPQMQRPGQREPQMQRPGQREPQMQRPERKQGGPAQTPAARRGREMQPSERRQGMPAQGPAEGKRHEMQPFERRQGPPEKGRAPAPGPVQQRQPSMSPPRGPERNPERVNAPRPPVSGNRGGSRAFREGAPSQRAEEGKTENRKVRKGQEEQKRGEPGRRD